MQHLSGTFGIDKGWNTTKRDFLGQQGKSMLGFMHFLHTLKVNNKVPLHIEVVQSTDT